MSDDVRLASTLEREIGDLRGVRGAKVELGPSGIESLRVLVIPERSTPETLDDVQELVTHRLGTAVDASRIQVIRAATANGQRERRRLTSVTTERSDDGFKARVMLELGGDVLVGESVAPTGTRFELRSMAKAILEGMSDLIEFPIELQGVHFLQAGEERLAVVILTRGDTVLAGSALVQEDDYVAVARATLNALNRFTRRPKPAAAAPV